MILALVVSLGVVYPSEALPLVFALVVSPGVEYPSLSYSMLSVLPVILFLDVRDFEEEALALVLVVLDLFVLPIFFVLSNAPGITNKKRIVKMIPN